jgi:hypothetical protein
MFNYSFSEIVRFMRSWGKVWYSQTGHRQCKTMHALCMLCNYGYRHTLKICYSYCFSTAAMVTRTRPLLRYTYNSCLVFTISTDVVCFPCKIIPTCYMFYLKRVYHFFVVKHTAYIPPRPPRSTSLSFAVYFILYRIGITQPHVVSAVNFN